jgi:hypothetical protein
MISKCATIKKRGEAVKSKIKVEYKDINKIIPYINNPRKNAAAVDKVAASIKEFGFKNPIIVDAENVIVAGHTRLLAAQKLELKEVPVIKADDLTENQIKAYRIADNKTSEFAEWDMELLEVEFEGLDDIFTGFSTDEIDKLLHRGFNYDSSEFGEDFSLPSGDKNPIEQRTFTLHEKQAELIDYAMNIIKNNYEVEDIESFGNSNNNGNLLYMVVKEWAELNK